MVLTLLKSRISKLRVTGFQVRAESCLQLDPGLMARAGLVPFERVVLLNDYTGRTVETWVTPAGESGQGHAILGGTLEQFGRTGDRLTIQAFAWIESDRATDFKPIVIEL